MFCIAVSLSVGCVVLRVIAVTHLRNSEKDEILASGLHIGIAFPWLNVNTATGRMITV
jgi:hypothetical protein